VNESPDSIERELERTRARLGDHLDELTRRLSPGQLVDEALMYVKEGQAAEFVRNLGTSVRDNPLPVALIGAGLVWLAFSSMRGGSNGTGSYSRSDWQYRQNDVAERARRAGESLTRQAGETEDAFQARVAEVRGRMLGLTQEAQETASSFMSRVQEALQAAQDQAQRGWRQAQETARGWTGGVRDAIRQGTDSVSGMASYGADWSDRANRSLVGTMQENPLIIGALGIAAGAIVGSLLPLTESESNLLREPARQAVDAARAAKEELVNRATHAASAAARAGMDAAAHPDHERSAGAA
jgi:hypothetical protein